MYNMSVSISACVDPYLLCVCVCVCVCTVRTPCSKQIMQSQCVGARNLHKLLRQEEEQKSMRPVHFCNTAAECILFMYSMYVDVHFMRECPVFPFLSTPLPLVNVVRWSSLTTITK